MLGTRLVSVLLLLSFSLGTNAQEARQVPFDQLLTSALETNPALAAARARIAEARGILRQAGMRPAPDLEISASSGRPFGSSGEEEYSASYSHRIEMGGKRSKRIGVAEIGLAVAAAEVAEETRHLTHRMLSKYIEALADQEETEALDRLIAIHKEFLTLVEARVAEGDAAPLERQLISVDLGQSQAQKAVAVANRESAVRELLAIAGEPTIELPTLSELPPLTSQLPLAEFQQRALRNRPDLLRAGISFDQAQAEIALAEAEGRSDLTLVGGYSREYGGFDDLSGVDGSGRFVPLEDKDDKLSVGVHIPLGTRRRNAGNVEAARARAAGASLRNDYTRKFVLVEVENALGRVQAARQAIELFDQGVLQTSEQNLEIIRQAYELGQLRLIDVLNEQRRVIEVRFTYINAKTEFQRAVADLELAVGGSLR